jgi:hypothetical protein
MRLEQMYQNVLSLDFNALVLKVEQDSIKRDRMLQEVTKIDATPSRKSGEAKLKLSDEDKSILKALGLSMKDIKTLKYGG